MPDDQLAFAFDLSPVLHPGPVPHLRDEIAKVWGLRLGERVEITFRPAFSLSSVVGLLELRTDPDYPWDAHQSLALRVAGCDFTTRDIASWRLT